MRTKTNNKKNKKKKISEQKTLMLLLKIIALSKSKITNFVIRFIGIIEIVFLYDFIGRFIENSDMENLEIMYLFWAYIVYTNVRGVFRVLSSKAYLRDLMARHRMIRVDGDQGGGKTSIIGYCLSTLPKDTPIYSLTPMKIRGRYVEVLTLDHIFMKRKIKEGAVLFIDELTLLFNNKSKSVSDNQIKSFEILLQLLRHFFDGRFFYASVDTGRALLQIEEKFRHKWQMLGQRSKRYSFVLAPLIQMIQSIIVTFIENVLEKEIKPMFDEYLGTFRIWTQQTYEKIAEEGYNFDLSTDDTNKIKQNKFANLNEIWAYNTKAFDYNDRALKPFYEMLNLIDETTQFTSLDMSAELTYLQYKNIVLHLVNFNGLEIKILGKNYSRKNVNELGALNFEEVYNGSF